MKFKLAASQLVFFIALFFLVNIIIFVPDYYALKFESGICDNLNDPSLTEENLPESAQYYEKACDSALQGWRHRLVNPSFGYHLVPLLISGVVTVLYSYYRVLDYTYERSGVSSDG